MLINLPGHRTHSLSDQACPADFFKQLELVSQPVMLYYVVLFLHVTVCARARILKRLQCMHHRYIYMYIIFISYDIRYLLLDWVHDWLPALPQETIKVQSF